MPMCEMNLTISWKILQFVSGKMLASQNQLCSQGVKVRHLLVMMGTEVIDSPLDIIHAMCEK